MERKKEVIKSLLLIFLICSSVFLTFRILGYKPEYEILGARSDKQKATKNTAKQQTNSLNLLAPNIIIKKDKNTREEQSLANSIVKINKLQATKEVATIKEILSKISLANILGTRIRNRDIKEIISESNNYYNFKYKYDIDTLSSKNIYLGDNNQAISYNFDNVLITDYKKNNIYLYKEGSKDYFQIEFEEEIYKEIENIFKEKSSIYNMYRIDEKKDIFIKEEPNKTYYIDKYEYIEKDILDISKDIFSGRSNIKVNKKDEYIKEVTDGYAILRVTDEEIKFINPSNIIQSKTDLKINYQEKSSTFLISGYMPKLDYTIISNLNNEVIYQEIYKDGLVFSNDQNSSIKIKMSSEGVYEVNYPKKIRSQKISEDVANKFLVENIAEILNYLYANVNLSSIEDIELGYEKIYEKNTIIYIPRWYIKYNGEYMKYAYLKNKIKKGDT